MAEHESETQQLNKKVDEANQEKEALQKQVKKQSPNSDPMLLELVCKLCFFYPGCWLSLYSQFSLVILTELAMDWAVQYFFSDLEGFPRDKSD